MSIIDLKALIPYVIVSGGALLLLLWDLFQRGRRPIARLYVTGIIPVMAWVFSWPQLAEQGTAFHGAVFVDPYTLCFYTIILLGVFVTFLLHDDQLQSQGVDPSVDVDVLILLAAAGGMVMVSAANLIVLFLGFELLSVSVYVLSGLAKKEKASSEGALKYFIMGAFSSAFLLYGMAFVYGATGTIDLQVLHALPNLGADKNPMLIFGVGLLIFGFGFKVSLVPFHFWTPDVYQGAPTSIAGFMAVVVKAAAFGAFFRVLVMAFGGISDEWVGLLWILSVLTMTFGNIVALRQRSIKRMLAYSSIAHAGYLMIGFVSLGSAQGGEAMIFYLLVYAVMTLAAFGVVLVATSGSELQYGKDSIESLSKLGWTHPLIGFTMVIAMLSLAGVPPLAGFSGKFFLFRSAVQAGFPGLAIIAAMNSVISLYYYLRVIVVMYFSDERKAEWLPPKKMLLGARVALTLMTVGTIYFGLFSWRYFAAAQRAIESLG